MNLFNMLWQNGDGMPVINVQAIHTFITQEGSDAQSH